MLTWTETKRATETTLDRWMTRVLMAPMPKEQETSDEQTKD